MVLGLGYALVHGNGESDLLPIHEGPSAAIVDQLSHTIPNATFVTEATQILNASGYLVDYYSGEEVTVDFYKRLPSMGYDVLVLRTHSTAKHADPLDEDVVIFTGEEYSRSRHVQDQYEGRLGRVMYGAQQYEDDGRSWFAIRPSLIRDVNGDFDGAIVFMMGCQGIPNSSMAEVFLDAGAQAYIGWDTEVAAARTDTATMAWLTARFEDGVDSQEAVRVAMEAIGEDPLYASELGILNHTGDVVSNSQMEVKS